MNASRTTKAVDIGTMHQSKYQAWLTDNSVVVPSITKTKMLVLNKYTMNATEHWALFLDGSTPLMHRLVYTTNGSYPSPQINVFASVCVFPQRKQIFVIDAHVQYQDSFRRFSCGKLRVLKKLWFRKYQRHIMETMTDAFFGNEWRVCYGMYPRHLKSIQKHFRKKNQEDTMFDRLPWLLTVSGGKEYYRIQAFTLAQMSNALHSYITTTSTRLHWGSPTEVYI